MPPRWGLKLFSGVGFYNRAASPGLTLTHGPPGEILKNLAALEKEITAGVKELSGMLR